jgi:hypothetical protein
VCGGGGAVCQYSADLCTLHSRIICVRKTDLDVNARDSISQPCAETLERESL